MKLGRLVLTHREDLIPALKDFYLGPRTDFLVIGADPSKVDPKKFETTENFRIFTSEDPGIKSQGTMSGRQYKVWIEAAKRFPDIETWVIHDYDAVVRPPDADIVANLRPEEYAMIGQAFPVWQKGMTTGTPIDTYPFPEGHRYWHKTDNPNDKAVDDFLMERYPVMFEGIPTLVGGYSDFVATSRVNILLLDDPKIPDALHGTEQLPHTIWRSRGVRPVDIRKFWKANVRLDVVYVPMSEEWDFMHPVKFWPGQAADWKALLKNAKYKLKSFVKYVINREGRRK